MIILSIVIFGMAAMQFIDCISYIFRLAGQRIGLISLGYSAQVLFGHASRLVVMVTFPMVGLLVDDQKTGSILIAGVICCGITAVALSSILIFNDKMQLIGIWLIRRIFSKRISSESNTHMDVGPIAFAPHSDESKMRDQRVFWIGIMVYAIYSFNLFAIPIVASLYPENRVFIVQLSPALNAVGTFMLAYFIDPTFSIAVDRNESPVNTLKHIVSARIAANTVVFLLFLAVFVLDVF